MDGAKKNILIVDDETLNLRVLAHILSSDYTLLTANDGSTAVDMAKEFQPDLILLDIVMPGMDGYEVLSNLKASDKTKDIPVIIITGLDISDSNFKELFSEAADYINKPFNAEIVKSKIRGQIKET
jgi:CheY-like chemotaxis protein